MHSNALEETELIENTNEHEPQSEISEPTSPTQPELPGQEAEQPETQEEEGIALISTEPEVIEGEFVELEPQECPEVHTPPKQKPYWVLIPFTIVLCLLFLAGSILLPQLSPSATVTIIPVEKSLSITTAIQVHGRSLAPLTLSESTSVSATGKRHQDATRAAGTVTFYNGSLSEQTIAAGTALTSSDGTQVVTDQPAIIPAGNPPIYGQVTVSAHAVLAGSQGNIPAYDINTACCATSIVAKNTGAFTGGAVARDYIVVTRTDINSPVTPLLVTLSQSEDAALQVQLHPGEALITPSCTPHVSSDHKPGDAAKQVSVIVSVTCSGIAYDAHFVAANATQLITSQVITKLGATYSLIGDIQVSIIHATISDPIRGIATIVVKIDATCVSQLSPREKQHLVQLIAGKPKRQAITSLLQFPGIQAASIQLAGGNTALPADPNHIHLTVMYRSS